MQSVKKDPVNLARTITLVTLLFTVLIGAVLVVFPIKPFWVDEWFIIDSLKTKDAAALFGPLDFMQQFPRVYLLLIKSFTSFFNYNYFSLRLPSYLVSVSVIVLSYKIMKRIYGAEVFTKYLFVLILISSFTYTEYFVEVKQYSMDMLTSIVALWQLGALFNLADDNRRWGRYTLLCISFLVVPFFSYTYPIAIAPVYFVVFLQSVSIFKRGTPSATKWRIIFMQWGALSFCALGIFLFYLLDAQHLASDKIMYDRWSFLIISNGHRLTSFLKAFYTLFSQTGNGLLFESLFGILGIGGLLFGIFSSVKDFMRKEVTLDLYIRIYSCALLILAFALFLYKKLPLGTPRLNCFTTPAIAILVIHLLNKLAGRLKKDWQKFTLPVVLYAGVTGNVYTTYINYFSSPRYKKQMSIYMSSQKAINLAQDSNLPILVTPGITYPYEQATTDAGAPDPAVWVLKTFPAYDVHLHLPVYAIRDTGEARTFLNHLPPIYTAAVAGDGEVFHIITKN